MKKILFCTNSAWNLYNYRGPVIEKVLSDQRFLVMAAAKTDGYVNRLPDLIKFFPLRNMERNRRLTKDVALFVEFRKLLRLISPDLLITFTIKPNILATLAAPGHTKVINNITGLGSSFLGSSANRKMALAFYKKSLRRATRVIFHNEDDLDLLIKSGILERAKCSLIEGSGVDTDHFSNSPDQHGIVRFTFVGRLIRDKGIIELLTAHKSLKDYWREYSLTIVGNIDNENPSGISENDLNTWFSFNSNVRRIPFTDDIVKIYRKTDVLIAPSYREGMSKVILEAMSMSLPVITTDVAGCKQAVTNGREGLVVQPKDSERLAEAMKKMIEIGPLERSEMGNRGREKVLARFRTGIISEKFSNIIEEVLYD